MPRKSASKGTPKAPKTSEEVPSRRGNRTPAKKPAAEPATPPSEPKRSRRSSTAVQTAASQAESRKTRSHSNRSSSQSSLEKSSSRDESADISPASRSTRRPMKKVNYEESEGEEDTSDKTTQREEDYNAEEDLGNDSDSLEAANKDKEKMKTPVPAKGRASRSRGESHSPRVAQSSRKKKKGVDDDEEEEEEDATTVDEIEAKDVSDGPAPATAPTRKGRYSTDKDVPQKDEKPKEGTRSRRSAAATPNQVTSSSARPTRAARQQKVANTEKEEPPKPLRTSTRSRRSRGEETVEEKVEELENSVEQKDEETEEIASEKEEEIMTDSNKIEDGSANEKVEVDESKELASEEQSTDLDQVQNDGDEVVHEENQSEEPMEINSVEDNKENVDKTKENKVSEDEEEEVVDEKEDSEKAEEEMEGINEENQEVKETEEDTAKVEDPVEDVEPDIVEKGNDGDENERKQEEIKPVNEISPGKDQTDLKEDVINNDSKIEKGDTDAIEEAEEEQTVEEDVLEDEPMEEEADCVADETKSTEEVEETKKSESSEHSSPSTNQNQEDSKHLPTVNSFPSNPSVEQSKLCVDEPANSKEAVSASAEIVKSKESLQSSVKNQDNVNGASTHEEMPKSLQSKSEPTQMLPSSAIELNQQHLTSMKSEPEVVRVSANGHVSNDKALNADVTTKDMSSWLLRERPYYANRSPCAEALSRHRERTFGIVSLNLESIKVDDQFLLELKTINSDIICMQGISPDIFHQKLEPNMVTFGFKGTFAQDEGRVVATFYKSSVFQLKSQKSLPLKQTIGKDLEHGLSPGERLAVAEKLPLCGQVLFTYLSLTQSTRAVAIANVLVPPSDVSTQALQMSCLAREAVAFLESGGMSGGIPLVLCGAFNMQQQEAAYQLLRDGYLSNEMIEILQSKKELKLPGRDEDTSLVNLMWKSFQHSASGLKSCYSAVTGKEFEFGSHGLTRTSPDLIWFSSDSLTPIGVLQAPPSPTGHHLLLKADLAFNY